ncbi:hypothetical protein B0H13DRAFT_1656080 [Mycena leptocephala]|nr:hypothetical protein B0H13DRAFT_1656080 [Mycena leptocephala]
MGGTWLHLAVTQGDLPLAHECIRLGTPIEHEDRRGYSALYFACTKLKSILQPDGPVSRNPPAGRKLSDNFVLNFVSQLKQICLFLLEQHADPNETHDGISLLGLACLADQWDIIQALLLHGAHTSPSSSHTIPTQQPARLLKTQHARSKFDAHVATYSGKPRPPRLCPCGSRRALEDCHSRAQPYPEEGICPCGSGKIYAKCCTKQANIMYWVEKWDSGSEQLKRVSITRVTQNPEIQSRYEGYVLRCPDLGPLRALFFAYNQLVLKDLAEHSEIDPAYAAAAFKVKFNPIPKLARGMTKVDLGDLAQTWNTAVDEYIASGVDSRATETIENAAKVGATGGPLYRKCEAAGCPSLEHRNGVKLSLCSGCDTAVYCSRTCQKSAWKAHRSACRAGNVRAQMLPSQEAYLAELNFFFQEMATSASLREDKLDPEVSDVIQSFMRLT